MHQTPLSKPKDTKFQLSPNLIKRGKVNNKSRFIHIT